MSTSPKNSVSFQVPIAHPAVEALDEGVLDRLAWGYEGPVDRVDQRRLQDPVLASQIGRLRAGLSTV